MRRCAIFAQLKPNRGKRASGIAFMVTSERNTGTRQLEKSGGDN